MTATECTALEHVILVDEHDKEIGLAEKLIAHQQNLRHRAFSIFIFREFCSEFELLLTQRAFHKYHSGGLWTNTCCSHPRAGETIIEAGERRLKEELGISTILRNIGWFHYNVHFENGLFENEIDHVLIGKISVDANIHLNVEEVNNYRWLTLDKLNQEIIHKPEQFTPWLIKALKLISLDDLI